MKESWLVSYATLALFIFAVSAVIATAVFGAALVVQSVFSVVLELAKGINSSW